MPAPKGHPNYARPDNLGGRPHLYDADQLAEELMEWSDNEDSLYLKEFTSARKVPASYLTRWAKESERFCEALEIAKDRQEIKLFKGALKGKLKEGTAKLGLSIQHGWKEEKIATVVQVVEGDLMAAALEYSNNKSRNGPNAPSQE